MSETHHPPTIHEIGLPQGPQRAEGPYCAPKMTVLGSLRDFTQVKALNASDGAMFFGVPEGFGS